MNLIGAFSKYLSENEVICLSTYHSGKMVCIWHDTLNTVSSLRVSRELPSGISIDGNNLYLASISSVDKFVLSLQEIITSDSPNISLLSKRKELILVQADQIETPKILCHEVLSFKDSIFLVNTRFSCISRINSCRILENLWTPPFITEYRPDDYCHLNGFAFIDGSISYATSFSTTNFSRGWRLFPYSSGVMVDVVENRIVADQLVLPHSPRIFDDLILVLESGLGSLTVINPSSGSNHRVLELPGFTRGLALNSRFAFVGISTIRNSNLWNDLPVKQKYKQPNASVVIIDLFDFCIVDQISLLEDDFEIFDIQICIL